MQKTMSQPLHAFDCSSLSRSPPLPHFLVMDAATHAFFRDNYLCCGISFAGLARFQREFRPDIISQVTGKELYQIVLEFTRPPESRPFVKIPYYESGKPFFAPEELGEGNVCVLVALARSA
jgi:hypothetical protein